MSTLEVREHIPTKCSTTLCPNHSGEGRMVTVRWKRQPNMTSSGLMNELELCKPCYDTLFSEIAYVARG